MQKGWQRKSWGDGSEQQICWKIKPLQACMQGRGVARVGNPVCIWQMQIYPPSSPPARRAAATRWINLVYSALNCLASFFSLLQINPQLKGKSKEINNLSTHTHANTVSGQKILGWWKCSDTKQFPFLHNLLFSPLIFSLTLKTKMKLLGQF